MYTLASFTSHCFYFCSWQQNTVFGMQALISRLNSFRSLCAVQACCSAAPLPPYIRLRTDFTRCKYWAYPETAIWQLQIIRVQKVQWWPVPHTGVAPWSQALWNATDPARAPRWGHGYPEEVKTGISNSISSVIKPEAQAGIKYKRDFFKQQFYGGKPPWNCLYNFWRPKTYATFPFLPRRLG